MISSPLRELARCYAAGELSQEQYRAQRRELINAVTSGKQKLEYEGALSHGAFRRHWRWLAPLCLAVIAAIGVAVFTWVKHPNAPNSPSGQATALPQTGPELVRRFLETNDWSDASLERFMQNWKLLPAAEQRKARHSYLFPRLTSQLREQIVSQQAMEEITPGANSGAAHLSRLQQVAAALNARAGN